MGEQKKSKSTLRSDRNRARGGRSGTHNRTDNGPTQAGRPTAKKSAIVRIKPGEDLISHAARQQTTFTPKPIDMDQLKQGWAAQLGRTAVERSKQKQWSMDTINLVRAYIKELFCGEGRTPEGLDDEPKEFLRWEFAKLCHRQVAPNTWLPGKTQDWFHQKLALAKTTGTRPVQKTEPAPQKSTTAKSAATSETAGKPAAKKAAKPPLNRAAQHAQKARKHELVSRLDPEVDEFAYRGAHKLLAHFEALTKRELTTDNGGKIARTTEAERRAFNDLDKDLLSHEMAELRRGFEAAKDALNATFERTDGTKPNEPKPAAVQPQQKPTLTVVPTPAQVFAPKPVSVAS